MNDIERTLRAVVSALTKEVQEINKDEVLNTWREYYKLWPDIGRAMGQLQETLLAKIAAENENISGEETTIILGQYMKNLSWALQKKYYKSGSGKDSFLKKTN